MPSVPVPADPGWDDDLAWLDRDPMTRAELEAQLDRLCELDEPDLEDEDEYWDHDDLTAEELAEIREAAADELLAVAAASTGRRGPGQPGSARVFPGESASTAAGFGTGMPLDVTPGCPELAVAADAAAGGGDEDCFDGVADHELIGLLCAWDRLEAHMAARKLAVAAELFRRNPEDGFEPSPGAMPEVVSEFAADQLACALAESRNHADGMLTMAWHLATRLTGTMAALRDGVITRYKAEIIVRATVTLEPEEAKEAEAKVLDRAGRLTPGSLRAAIARAVMEVGDPTVPLATLLDLRRRARPGPDRHPRLHQYRPVRASFRSQGARPRSQAAASVPDPAFDVHCAGMCGRPAASSDFEHNTPFEAGGRSCLCNGGPLYKR